MTSTKTMLRLRAGALACLLCATLSGGCAAARLEGEPLASTPRLAVAALQSQVLATVELRLLRVPHELADAWAGEDRRALRVSYLPQARLEQILKLQRKVQRTRTPYAPRITVHLGQDARVGVQEQHTYLRDYVRDEARGGLRAISGGFETGLQSRVRIDLKEDESWPEPLRTWVRVSGEFEISQLVELEELELSYLGQEVRVEVPKLRIQRHALDLEVQEEVVALLAPPMAEGSDKQILILLKVSLTQLGAAEREPTGR